MSEQNQSPKNETEIERSERILRNIASVIDKFEYSGINSAKAMVECGEFVQALLLQVMEQKRGELVAKPEVQLDQEKASEVQE